MKLAVISHAYQEERYLSVLDSMGTIPGIELSLIHPRTYKGQDYVWMAQHAIR